MACHALHQYLCSGPLRQSDLSDLVPNPVSVDVHIEGAGEDRDSSDIRKRMSAGNFSSMEDPAEIPPKINKSKIGAALNSSTQLGRRLSGFGS